ncbi:MAG: hypothetical protein M0Z68_02355, partial [Gammaproteobacteria bacterium]|nr:hypothetical protein [Gammaproteobacteria bacterium]
MPSIGPRHGHEGGRGARRSSPVLPGNNGIPVEPDIFTRAISDALKGAKPLLPPAQMASVVAKFQKQ